MHLATLPPQPKDMQRMLAGFQSEADAMAYEKEPVMARLTLYIILGAFILAAAIASQVRIDRIVVGSGQLATTQPTVVVQSLNRAIIKSIHVREGDRVRAGDVLATLDPTFTAADVAQVEVQLESLDAEIERLEAERADRPLNVQSLSPKYAQMQMNLMNQRRAQKTEQLRSLDSKIVQLQASVVKHETDHKRFAERARILRDVENMRDTLYQKELGSRLNLLQARDQRLEMSRNADLEANALIEVKAGLETARAERESFVEQWMTQINTDLVQKRTARDSAAEQMQKASKNHELVNLKAPTDAIVQRTAKLSVGSVLLEASPMFTLVPIDAPIEAEVSIEARDIGFIRVGDPVAVKLESFNYLEHGYAEGTVRTISEDAFTTSGDDSKTPVRPYYKALVVVDKSAMQNVPDGFRLMPGMPLTADIKVGTRTLLSYVSHGITRSLREGMREP
jgi:hemolysin D